MNQEQKTKFPEPFYYLVFKINASEDVKLRSLFTELKSFFENFPVLRWAGWDFKLGTGANYSIDLEGIEHIDASKRIRVFENGGLLVQGALNSNFLCWGGGQEWDEAGKSKKIHSLALIEFTYSSFVALQRILQDVENPHSIQAEIGFVGINNEFSLRYNKIGSGIISFEETFINKGSNFTSTFSVDDLSNENLPVTVYSVIEKIYRMFGLDGTKIPYTKEVLRRNMIDIQQIKDIK